MLGIFSYSDGILLESPYGNTRFSAISGDIYIDIADTQGLSDKSLYGYIKAIIDGTIAH